MTNKTQCPECFAVFMITDEQLIRSKGQVHCGRCRNAFHAKLLPIEIAEDLDEQQEIRAEAVHINAQDGVVNDNNISQIVSRSEIRKSVIPKLSDNWTKPQSASEVNGASDNPELSKADQNSWFLKNSELGADPNAPQSLDKEPPESDSPSYIATQVLADAFSVIDDTPSFNFTDDPEPNKNKATSTDQQTRNDILVPEDSMAPDQGHVDQNLTDAFALIDETPSFNAEGYSVSTFNDDESVDSRAPHTILSEQAASVAAEEVSKTSDDSRSAGALKDIEEAHAEPFDSEMPGSSQFNEPTSNQVIELDTPCDEELQPRELDESLVAEVDQLISEKPSIDSIDGDQNDLSYFSKTTKHNGLARWVFGPLLGLMAILLIAVLSYQLWLKQAVPILESTQLATALEPISKPFKNQLKKYDVILPERRNLNRLELLSARTEAHPSRSSTILLRASLINRAKISQPFPWLELSLSDEEGRLVSRRALSPNDYLHNNRLQNKINANELKRVTIELLTFPKQAHGFELRLLNK